MSCLKYFLDTGLAGRRAELWKTRGFVQCPNRIKDWAVGKPLFLLVHTRDLAKSLNAAGSIFRDPDDFLSKIRDTLATCPVALLYISAAPDPWGEYLGVYTKPAGDPWVSVFESPVDDSDTVFANRLDAMLHAWDDAGGANPPDWTFLTHGWARDAIEYLAAAKLAYDTGDLDSFLSAHEREDPFKDWGHVKRTVKCSGAQMEVLDAVAKGCACGDRSEFLSRVMDALRVLRSVTDREGSDDEAEALRVLESERSRLRHRLFYNGFVGSLGSGFRDDRYSEEDVVLRAFGGDTSSRETVRSAVDFWEKEVFPPLHELVRSVSTERGFVTTKAWEKEVAKLLAADATIRATETFRTDPDKTPRELTEGFWAACDVIEQFLKDLRTRSHELFARWDSNVITGKPAA